MVRSDSLRDPHRGRTVLTGEVTEVDLSKIPMDGLIKLRLIEFHRAHVSDVVLPLDEVKLTASFSTFDHCTFSQRSRRLHQDGYEPQGSFGTQPSTYRGCTFIGVRMRIRAGFHVGQARFEDCTFDRCRFEEFFSHSAEFVRCRFVGRVKMAVIYGTDPTSGQRNEIVDNDFTKAELTNNIGLRGDLPVHLQRWPDGFMPRIEPGRQC